MTTRTYRSRRDSKYTHLGFVKSAITELNKVMVTSAAHMGRSRPLAAFFLRRILRKPSFMLIKLLRVLTLNKLCAELSGSSTECDFRNLGWSRLGSICVRYRS